MSTGSPPPRSQDGRSKGPKSGAPPASSVRKRPRAGSSGPQKHRRPRRAARRTRVAIIAMVVLALVAAGVFGVFVYFVDPLSPGPSKGRVVSLSLRGDETPSELATRLSDEGLVRRASRFALWLRARGIHVAPGRHLLTDDLSPVELADLIERSARVPKVRVVVPEGYTMFDVGKRLEALKVCAADALREEATRAELLEELGVRGASAEGYLFPATYEFPKNADPQAVVRRMVREFDKRFAALEQKHQGSAKELESALGWARHDFVTFASIIEREAAVADERPIIASVFLNRLRDPSFKPRRMLQSDPTAGYGCLVSPSIPSCAAFAGKITHDMLVDETNVYNTYKHDGLPPGPIANPGEGALEAALSPATTRYFYFVARGDRRHTFSETYAAHNAAIRRGGTNATGSADGATGPTRAPGGASSTPARTHAAE